MFAWHFFGFSNKILSITKCRDGTLARARKNRARRRENSRRRRESRGSAIGAVVQRSVTGRPVAGHSVAAPRPTLVPVAQRALGNSEPPCRRAESQSAGVE